MRMVTGFSKNSVGVCAAYKRDETSDIAVSSLLLSFVFFRWLFDPATLDHKVKDRVDDGSAEDAEDK